MKKIFLLLSTSTTFFALAQSSYWQQQVNFTINASLNDVEHSITGFETIEYINHSPDTLSFIWFHLWPNAFKNDKTAYSEQEVERLNNTNFYFSNSADRGYINKLNFKVDNQVAILQDHPQYIDIQKLILPKPLAPGATIIITTPFHVKLSKNFSRGGHIGQSYQLTQWYPKPAVYDRTGWHPMPYLDQGEFYNEFGNYQVAITLPKNYVVAATGQLQDETEKQFLETRSTPIILPKIPPTKKDIFAKKKNTSNDVPPSDANTKTIHYQANNVIDFAWFADKRFIVQHGTTALPNNPRVDVYTYVLPSQQTLWKNSVANATRALQFYNDQLGTYPYPTLSIVCAPPALLAGGGMEYPTITLINVGGKNEEDLDITMAHEIGHNWLQGMIATNERDHPWMDEGMNTFYEKKYHTTYYALKNNAEKYETIAPAEDAAQLLLQSQIALKTDQPIETTSENFTQLNYAAVAYAKAALWMEKLEATLGQQKMKAAMQAYFAQWKMKHPYPEDFKQIIQQQSQQNLNELFDLLNKTGNLQPEKPRPTKLSLLLPKLDGAANYLTLLPAIARNANDGLMLGAAIHNINFPGIPLQFAAVPLYAFGSKQFNFIGAVGYTIYPTKKFYSITPALSISRFSTDNGTGQQYDKLYKGFLKITPAITFQLPKKNPLSNFTKWIQIKSFLITEGSFDFVRRSLPQDTFSFYAKKGNNLHRSIAQLSFGIDNNRPLYPYNATLQLQQTGNIVRASISGNYLYNYDQKQGVNIRFFAGKIFYTKTKTDKIRFANDRYQFSLYAANGYDDYTYSNPFYDRNQGTALENKQIFIRDGGFKYRSDFSSQRPGRSDDWLAALNFCFDIPTSVNPLSVLPFKVPLKIFADVGTYSEAWQENNTSSKFLYTVGLQLPILRYLNFYLAVLQSKQFKEPNSLNGPKWWQKNLTFSVDIQNIKQEVGGIKIW